MKLVVNYFDNSIELLDGFVNSVEIMNKSYFIRFINDLNCISNGEMSENINIFDKDNNLIEYKDFNIFFDYFNFNFDDKKYQNYLSKYILSNIDTSYIDSINKILSKLYDINIKFLNNLDIGLEIDENISYESIIKFLKFKIKSKKSLIENIFLAIDLENIFNTNNVLIFINLKNYLSNEQLIEVYKYSIYKGIHIVLVDSIENNKLEYEKKLIIDDNYEEFML